MLRLIFILFAFSSFAYGQTADDRLKHDKYVCSTKASEEHAWIVHPILWRTAYNSCLRERLRLLTNHYTSAALEAIRMEEECPSILLHEQPTELSLLGFQIVNHLTTKEMQSSMATNNIEYHLKLYHQREIDAVRRIHELRK